MSLTRNSTFLTDTLLKEAPYASDQNKIQKELAASLKEELIFHYHNNDYYKRYCDRNKFDPLTFNGDIKSIPTVSVQVFKTLGPLLKSVGTDEIKIKLQSSATSGVPSTVIVDRITAKRQSLAMAKVIGEYIGKSRKPFVIIDVNPALAKSEALGARGAAVRAYLNFASSVEYVMDADKNNDLLFNKPKLVEFIKAQDETTPVIVFGFTYVLYQSLIKQNADEKNTLSLPLPIGSKIIHIGGWKKLENEKISKEIFNKNIAKVFNIVPEDVIDIYGFTEQMGLNYPDCEQGWKHVPSYAEVMVRDLVTNEVLDKGKEGALSFVTPIPHSYPGNAILTDDLGILADDEETCQCGRLGTRFKILGRIKKAEIRGCGDIMSDKMAQIAQKNDVKGQKKGLNILFYSGEKLNDASNEEEQLIKIINDLKARKSWLRNQPIEALIGIINKASKIWQDPNFELGEFREQGLAFLIDWCRSDNLRMLTDFSMRGRRSYLDGLGYIKGSLLRQIKAEPLGLVAHWLSGNVPVLGMLTLVQSIITKNVNILKGASDYSHAVPALLRAFEGLEYTTPGGYTLKGNDLLKTISVVYFGHGDNDLANIISTSANVRLAWGGGDAIKHVSSLPKRWTTQDILFGPKLSYMVIGNEVLLTERSIRKILRRAATDCSVFDQTACASPHTIFVERGASISPEEFAKRLGDEMEKALLRIPKTSTDDETYNAIKTARAVYEFTGNVWGGDNGSWTVLYDEQKGLASPTYSRVITVRPIDNIMEAAEYANEDMQTVGLAAKGKKRLDFADYVIAKGVERCPDVGRMTNFEMPWDGLVVMDRLVRWATLGGPV